MLGARRHGALRCARAPQWEEYATWRRFLHIFSPRVCYKVLLAILPAMLTVTLSTVACAAYEGLRPAGQGWPTLQETDLTLPYATVSFALSLLLVFKTNTCYARFWEGARRSAHPARAHAGVCCAVRRAARVLMQPWHTIQRACQESGAFAWRGDTYRIETLLSTNAHVAHVAHVRAH